MNPGALRQTPFEEGYDTFCECGDRSECPYPYDTDSWHDWQEGFSAAEDDEREDNE